MWQLIAIVLSAVLLFYWLAFMGTIWMWFNVLMSLWAGHFIRASIWFVCGTWMLFWWYDEPERALTWDDNGYLRFAAVCIGIGALATFVRWRKKQQAMQAMPTMPAWTAPAAVGNVVPFIKVKVERKRG